MSNSSSNPTLAPTLDPTTDLTIPSSKSKEQKDETWGEKFYDLFYSSKFRQYLYRSYIFFQIICLGIGIIYLKQIDPTANKFATGILAVQIISAILFFSHILIYFGVCLFRKFKKNQNPFDREKGSIYQIESASLFAAVGLGVIAIVTVGAMLARPDDAFKTEKSLKTILASVVGLVITNFIPWLLSLIVAFGINWFLTRK